MARTWEVSSSAGSWDWGSERDALTTYMRLIDELKHVPGAWVRLRYPPGLPMPETLDWRADGVDPTTSCC